MFELVGAGMKYGEAWALQPTDLRLLAAKTTVLIGPSGCGKSTILRLLTGLAIPTSGTVRFDGTKMTRDAVGTVRRRLGYMIQEGGLFPHLSAEGNVTLMARHLGWQVRQIRARLDELCTLTHFPPAALLRYPAQLSGGQRQRVSLMRALMLDPKALLLDEPLGALDPMIRAELQDDLRQIFRTLGKTVVLVTHDLAEAAFFGDEIVLLREGRVVQRGPVAELAHSPAEPFVSEFVRAQSRLWEALA